MSHNLNLMENGLYAFIGRENAWHDLGKVTGTLQTYKEIEEYCLNWHAYKHQLTDHHGNPLPIFGIYRSDNDAFLGIGSEKYTPIHHEIGFNMVSAILGEERCFETAGVLGVGQKVWGLGFIQPSKIGDDCIYNYLLYAKSYDRSIPDTFKLCKKRVVCENTINMALGEISPTVKVRNTKNAATIMQDKVAALHLIRETIAASDNMLTMFSNRILLEDKREEMLEFLFPLTATEVINLETKKKEIVRVSKTRRNNIIAKVTEIYEDNDGNALPEQRGTYYNFLNSITNYADHVRVVKNAKKEDIAEQSRFGSAMFGSGNDLKQRAWEIVSEYAPNAPEKPATRLFDFPTLIQEGEIVN